MESLFILIPVAIVIVSIAVLVFFWAVKSGQFEDLDTESKRILFDEAPKRPDNNKEKQKIKQETGPSEREEK